MAPPDPRDPDHHARPASHEAVGDPEELPELEVEPEGTPPPRNVDRDIEDAIRQGDPRRALQMMMLRHGDRVYRFAVGMLRDDTLAEEVAQQVFVEAYRDLHTFAFGGSVAGWLLAIARHRALDAGRRRRRAIARFTDEEPAHEPAYHIDVGEQLDRAVLAGILEGCIAKLKPAAREAVLLLLQQELSYKEVAEIVGERANTVEQRVRRCLKDLRRCVELKLGGKWP